MMSRTTIRLIIFVSFAHCMVHVFELSLPSVEQEIAVDFGVGKELTGQMGTSWRLPWGIGAVFVGWLVDRFGSHRMLAIYLLGCGAMCVVSASTLHLKVLFPAMFTMGLFAAIYHPAGLALISHTTTTSDRPFALGIHGIFGSLGIGGAPFLAGIMIAGGMSWRSYYFLLTVPAVLLGLFFLARWRQDLESPTVHTAADDASQEKADWPSFFTLTIVTMLSGLVYSGFIHFLPRYLSEVTLSSTTSASNWSSKCVTGGVLLVGCFGQYFSGRIARPHSLERQLMAIMILNAPCLILLGFTTGTSRIVAAGLFAFVHFMNQPVYNSLIAKYSPRRRRSLCYGFSFAVGLGFGGFGATLAGFSQSFQMTYSALAGAALLAGIICLVLVWLNARQE